MCLDLSALLAKIVPVNINKIENSVLYYHLILLDIFTMTFGRGEWGGVAIRHQRIWCKLDWHKL